MCVCVCVCVHLDGSNAENKISLLVILCIIMYVKKKTENSKPIMVKCLNIGKNIGKPIYRSISTYRTGPRVFWLFSTLTGQDRGSSGSEAP